MPLEIHFLQYEDIPAFAALDAAAMAGWGFAQAIQNGFPPGKSREQVIEDWTARGFGSDSELVWLKVVDSDAQSEMVAAGMWGFHQGQRKGSWRDAPAANADAGGDAPAAEVGGEAAMEGNEGGVAKEEAKAKPNIMAALDRMSAEYSAKFIQDQSRAHLHILVTHPKHQRRGAGGMLVRWGTELADQRGWISTLTASAAGLPLYLRNGFEVVWERELDLRPYGVDETELRRYMIRPAKARTNAP